MHVCACVSVCECECESMEVRELGVDSLLLSCEPQGLDSGHQMWWPSHFSNLSHLFKFVFLCYQLMSYYEECFYCIVCSDILFVF